MSTGPTIESAIEPTHVNRYLNPAGRRPLSRGLRLQSAARAASLAAVPGAAVCLQTVQYACDRAGSLIEIDAPANEETVVGRVYEKALLERVPRALNAHAPAMTTLRALDHVLETIQQARALPPPDRVRALRDQIARTLRIAEQDVLTDTEDAPE